MPQTFTPATVEALGLDPSALDLLSIESISCLLRRAAGYLCPCPQRTLLHSVVEACRFLVDDLEEFREMAERTLETLVAHGDLLELAPVSAR